MDRALQVGRGMATADPLTAEMLASAVLSVSRGELSDEAADREWADQLVERLARTRPADSLAFLTAIHVLAPPEWRDPAEAAISGLRRLGAPPPPWATALIAPRVLDAWFRNVVQVGIC